MRTLAPLALVLVAATAYGVWYQRSRGRITTGKSKKQQKSPNSGLSSIEIGADLGSRVTLVQFSSAFCSPCRATRALLTDITADMSDVQHVEIDAESHLELVRRLDIRSTPTTLILNSAGIEVGRAVGAPKRDQVITALAAVH
ncbi:MAG: thioredoxin family protein [Actinomycetes bacterium]